MHTYFALCVGDLHGVACHQAGGGANDAGCVTAKALALLTLRNTESFSTRAWPAPPPRERAAQAGAPRPFSGKGVA